jgi:hypothetical protein
MSEPRTASGRYKRDNPEKAREYQRRDNAKRSKEKQEAWRGVCVDCGGQTSSPVRKRCRSCWRLSLRS